MNLSSKMMGADMDRMPDIAFRIMSFIFVIRDMLIPATKKVDRFEIKKGDAVMDYGCGPGGYIQRTSELVGDEGKVYAADVHNLALEGVKRRIHKFRLKNVTPVLVENYSCPLNDRSIDLVYALDMFHMVKEPTAMLRELHRIIKENGRLIIEDGHQPRQKTKEKIEKSRVWTVKGETEQWLVCEPVVG